MTEPQQVFRWVLDRNTIWQEIPTPVWDVDQVMALVRGQRPNLERILVSREVLDYIRLQEFSSEQSSLTFPGDTAAKFFGIDVILWE